MTFRSLATVQLLLPVWLGAACNSPADQPPCLVTTALFSSTAPNFVGTTSKVTYESGPAPAGSNQAQYDLWLAVLPGTKPNVGVLLKNSTPVFERVQNGTVTPSSACAIKTGDVLEVSHDFRWAFGAVEAPPGDTLYFATQIVIRP